MPAKTGHDFHKLAANPKFLTLQQRLFLLSLGCQQSQPSHILSLTTSLGWLVVKLKVFKVYDVYYSSVLLLF